MYWQNEFAVQRLVVACKGEPYSTRHRIGVDASMTVIQDWLYQQCGGKTINLLPAKAVYGDKTAAGYAASNIYLDLKAQLDRQLLFDSTGQRIQFSNWHRCYVLFATGNPNLQNMAGRSAFGYPEDQANPLNPWGPGVAGGSSSDYLEIVAGLKPDTVNQDGFRLLNITRGGTIHEFLHCLGLRHPGEPGPTEGMNTKYGSEGWLTPMAGIAFFGTTGHLFPEEVGVLQSSPFFS